MEKACYHSTAGHCLGPTPPPPCPYPPASSQRGAAQETNGHTHTHIYTERCRHTDTASSSGRLRPTPPPLVQHPCLLCLSSCRRPPSVRYRSLLHHPGAGLRLRRPLSSLPPPAPRFLRQTAFASKRDPPTTPGDLPGGTEGGSIPGPRIRPLSPYKISCILYGTVGWQGVERSFKTQRSGRLEEQQTPLPGAPQCGRPPHTHTHASTRWHQCPCAPGLRGGAQGWQPLPSPLAVPGSGGQTGDCGAGRTPGRRQTLSLGAEGPAARASRGWCGSSSGSSRSASCPDDGRTEPSWKGGGLTVFPCSLPLWLPLSLLISQADSEGSAGKGKKKKKEQDSRNR